MILFIIGIVGVAHNSVYRPQTMKNSRSYNDFKKKIWHLPNVILFIIQYRFVPDMVKYIIKVFKQEAT